MTPGRLLSIKRGADDLTKVLFEALRSPAKRDDRYDQHTVLPKVLSQWIGWRRVLTPGDTVHLMVWHHVRRKHAEMERRKRIVIIRKP